MSPIAQQSFVFAAETTSPSFVDLTGVQEDVHSDSDNVPLPQSAVEPNSDSPCPPVSSNAEVFQSPLKASDPDESVQLATNLGLPPTPSTFTPERAESPSSTTTTLFGEFEQFNTENPAGPFFFKPVLKSASTSNPQSRRNSEEMVAEKMALKQMLKLKIPASSKHSLSHKRNAPEDLPLMLPSAITPAPARPRRHSLPSSPFLLVSCFDDDSDDEGVPHVDTPDHLLFTSLSSALPTQQQLDSPAEYFPHTPDSALFETQVVPIRMMEPEDSEDEDGYISDPGSAVARYFKQPEKAYPSIQRGKQLPFPVRPTKPKEVPVVTTSSESELKPVVVADVDRERKRARVAALKRRYHDLPSHYFPESPVLSPRIRSVGRALFDRSNKMAISSPLAGRFS